MSNICVQNWGKNVDSLVDKNSSLGTTFVKHKTRVLKQFLPVGYLVGYSSFVHSFYSPILSRLYLLFCALSAYPPSLLYTTTN